MTFGDPFEDSGVVSVYSGTDAKSGTDLESGFDSELLCTVVPSF